jgi:selenocysteine-specific elongation factor
MEALRDRLPWPASPAIFRAWVTQLERDGVVVRDGSTVRLPQHKTALQGEARGLGDRIVALLADQACTPPELPQIAAALGVERTRVVGLLRALEREGAVVHVAGDLYMLAGTLDEIRRALREDLAGGALLTPAAFRDRFGTSRKYAIPLLEYLDRDGLTERVGGARRLKRSST